MTIFYWFWLTFGIAALMLFIKMAIPKIKEVHALGKKRLWFWDSRITHKVAELFVWVPFFLIILFATYWKKEELLEFVDAVDELMLFGGFLAAYSFFEARGKYWWAYVIWFLALWGIFGGYMAREWIVPGMIG